MSMEIRRFSHKMAIKVKTALNRAYDDFYYAPWIDPKELIYVIVIIPQTPISQIYFQREFQRFPFLGGSSELRLWKTPNIGLNEIIEVIREVH